MNSPLALSLFCLALTAASVKPAHAAASHCGPDCALPSCDSFVESTFVSQAPGTPTYHVWTTKAGTQPVLFLHALGGLEPAALDFAQEAAQKHGLKVYAPDLFRVDELTNHKSQGFGYRSITGSMSLLDKSGRWDKFNPKNAGLILEDVRQMVRWVAAKHPGQRVTVIGNCLTGIFPLALLNEPCVKTAVICQPALPLKRTVNVFIGDQAKGLRQTLGISDAELHSAINALKQDKTKRLIGLHYTDDPLGPYEKFETIYLWLGTGGVQDQFKACVLLPPGDKSRQAWWTALGNTRETRTMISPHPTLLSTAPEDAAWFRSQLYRLLGVR